MGDVRLVVGPTSHVHEEKCHLPRPRHDCKQRGTLVELVPQMLRHLGEALPKSLKIFITHPGTHPHRYDNIFKVNRHAFKAVTLECAGLLGLRSSNL